MVNCGTEKKEGKESLEYRYSLWLLAILMLVPRPYHPVPQACSWDVLKLTKPGANPPIPSLELCCGVTCHSYEVIWGGERLVSPQSPPLLALTAGVRRYSCHIRDGRGSVESWKGVVTLAVTKQKFFMVITYLLA